MTSNQAFEIWKNARTNPRKSMFLATLASGFIVGVAIGQWETILEARSLPWLAVSLMLALGSMHAIIFVLKVMDELRRRNFPEVFHGIGFLVLAYSGWILSDFLLRTVVDFVVHPLSGALADALLA